MNRFIPKLNYSLGYPRAFRGRQSIAETSGVNPQHQHCCSQFLNLKMSPFGGRSLLLLVILLPFSSQQSCDSFLGSKQLDYALPDYTFDCSTTSDLYSCALRCLSYDRCKSCNYALSGPQRGLCELNREGRHASTPLQYRPGFVFVQAILKQVGFDWV